MRKVIVLVVVLMVALVTVPAFADYSISSNWEVFDEVSTIGEIGGSDALIGSKNFDLGVMLGVTNYKNPFNNEKADSYIMVKGDVKGIRLLNRVWSLITGK